MPVFLTSGLRYAISLLILAPLLWRQEKGFPSFCKMDLFILFLQALTGQFLFSVFLLFGLQYITASESGILTSTMPAVIVVLSFLFLKEKISSHKLAGVTCVVLGIMLMNMFGAANLEQRGANPLLGSFLVFGAVVGESAFTFFGKIVAGRLNPLTIVTSVTFFGLLLFSPFAFYDAMMFDFSTVPFNVWIALLCYGSVMTIVPFIFIIRGLALIPASTAAVLTGVMPVSSLLFAYLILNEPFLWTHLLGIGGVLLGIGFTARESPEQNDSKSNLLPGRKSTCTENGEFK